MGAVSFCDRGGYVCGDCYVTFLCDLFGGHSSTVMDGFADGQSHGGILRGDSSLGMWEADGSIMDIQVEGNATTEGELH